MLPDMGSMSDMMKLMPSLTKARAAMENAKGAGQSRGTPSFHFLLHIALLANFSFPF